MEIDMLVDKHGNCAEQSSEMVQGHANSEESDRSPPSSPSPASSGTTSPSAVAEIDLRKVKTVHFDIDKAKDVLKYRNHADVSRIFLRPCLVRTVLHLD